MKSLPERLEHMVAILESMEREERMTMLVDMAGQFRPVPPHVAQRPFPASHRVPGCESEAYVWSEPSADGNLQFYFAVENPQGISAMALAAILRECCSGAPLERVADIPADVVYRIFGHELSMGKSLGLMGLVEMVRVAAQRQLRKLGKLPAAAGKMPEA
jgi:cysteine desulfuration protein SufE